MIALRVQSLRDQRELLRLRIFLVRLRTRVKNRIHGTLARHNVLVPGADLFGVEARLQLGARLPDCLFTAERPLSKNWRRSIFWKPRSTRPSIGWK